VEKEDASQARVALALLQLKGSTPDVVPILIDPLCGSVSAVSSIDRCLERRLPTLSFLFFFFYLVLA
jgi:hypothetical protein